MSVGAIYIADKYKKEITIALFAILVVVSLVVGFVLIKKRIQNKKRTNVLNNAITGNSKDNKAISETLKVSEARVEELRRIAFDCANAMGTMPTNVTFNIFNLSKSVGSVIDWFSSLTEDEAGVISNLNQARSSNEINSIAFFYRELTTRVLKVDVDNYLSNRDIAKIKFYANL